MEFDFWQGWKKKYLNHLQHHHQWNVEIGSLIIIKEKDSLQLQWKMGRIMDILPVCGDNNPIYIIKTKIGTTKKYLHDICPIPSENHSPSKNQKVHATCGNIHHRNQNRAPTTVVKEKKVNSSRKLLGSATRHKPQNCTRNTSFHQNNSSGAMKQFFQPKHGRKKGEWSLGINQIQPPPQI